MLRITCGFACSNLLLSCAKKTGTTTAQLWFLLMSVFINLFLTQLYLNLNTTKNSVFTLFKINFYTQSTALITNTKYFNNFVNYY